MAKRKKYSLIMDEDDVVGIEVNGNRYEDAMDIPNEEDRSRVQHMVNSLFDAGVAEPAGKVDTTSKIVLRVFMGVTVLMLTILAISSFIILRGVMKEETAEGRVVDMVIRKDSEDRSYYYPMIEFNLPDGSIERVQLAEGSWPPAYVIGQPVAVRYNPQEPAIARIQTLGNSIAMWTLPIIMAVLSAAFLGATFFVRWIIKPEPAPKTFEQELYENA